jgi:hypothetical protein
MRLIEHTREWAVLPQVANDPVPRVEPLGIYSMSTMEYAVKGVDAFGHGHIVHMIGHQAIGKHLKVELLATLAKHLKVLETIGRLAKDLETPNASLSHMVRRPRHDNARGPRHDVFS